MKQAGMRPATVFGIHLLLLALWALVLWSPPAFATTSDESTVSVKPLDLARTPTVKELMAAGQLGGALHPTHPFKSAPQEAAVNLSFGTAIQAWNKHDYDRAAQLFQGHLDTHPDSPWASEAVLHLGCYAYYHGRYVDAEDSFNRILESNQGGTGSGQKMLLGKAKLRLGVLRVAQNRFDDALEIFTELKQQDSDWRHRTYASHWIQRLSRYKADRLALLDCGVKALGHMLKLQGNEAAARDVENIRPRDLKGFSLEVLSELAAGKGLELAAVRLPAGDGAKLSIPTIVFMANDGAGESGHYWVLEKNGEDRLELFDPQSGQRFNQSTEEFAREWSGIALVRAKDEKSPGVKLSKAEMEQIFGSCCGVPRPTSKIGACPEISRQDGGGCSTGSPTWSVNMVNMNIYVTDTPLWYFSPVGPSVQISLSYNSQSAIAYHEPFGNKWQFNYSSYLVVDPSQTVTVFMPDGRVDTFPPDGLGGYTQPYQVYNRLTRIADNHFELRLPDDTVYEYDIPAGTSSQQPFLVKLKDAHGQGLSFTYNASVQLTKITDAMGRPTTLTYNAQGLVAQVKEPFGRLASFLYDANKNLVQITDMGGYWSKLSYDDDIYLSGLENSRGKWQFYVEPADGINNNSNRYPSPGSTMWEDYRVTVTDPLGGKSEYCYNGYDSYSWYVSPADYRAYVSVDVNNYRSAPKTQYNYWKTGQNAELSSITYPGGGSVKFGYDSLGNKTSVTDAHNHTSTLTYNSMGRVTSITDPKGVPLQFVYAANGVDLLKVTNGLGSITRSYNTAHEVTTIRDRSGNPPWGFTYNGYGQVQTATDPTGVVTNYVYDSLRRLSQVKRAGLVTDTFTYDAFGRVAGHTDDRGFTTSYGYNALNNIVKVTYSDGKYEALTYSGCCPYLVDQATDRAGRITRYQYDALKRLTKVVNPAGDAVSYVYDGNGNLNALVDPNGNATSFDYDLNGRLVKKTFPDGKSVEFTYDDAGLLLTRTNARGIATVYGYDENHNLMTVSYSDDTPGVTYFYDIYNRRTQRHDAAGTSLFGYDKDSRPTSLDGPLSNDVLTFQYDKLGRRTGLTLQGGQSTTYSYDTLGRLTQIRNGTENYTYGYTGVNPLVQTLQRPNGSQTVYQYDALKRLNLVSHRNSANAVIQEYGYTYNGQDLRSGETKTDNTIPVNILNSTTEYGYNDLNQLTASTVLSTTPVPPAKTYLYDDDGNMTQGYTPEGYVFKATYDAENRMESIQYTGSGGSVYRFIYTYTADGAVAGVRSYTNGTLTSDTRYVREGFLALQERDAQGNVQRQYDWGLGMGGGIGGLLQLTQGGQKYSYLYDGRGNVGALLNASQAVAAAYTYDGYGNILGRSGSLDQPYKFSTKAYNEGTGLAYYGYRNYSPSMARWLTRDPIGEAGGMNLYGFVGGDPIGRADAYGLTEFRGTFCLGFCIGLDVVKTSRGSSVTPLTGVGFGYEINSSPNEQLNPRGAMSEFGMGFLGASAKASFDNKGYGVEFGLDKDILNPVSVNFGVEIRSDNGCNKPKIEPKASVGIGSKKIAAITLGYTTWINRKHPSDFGFIIDPNTGKTTKTYNNNNTILENE